MKYFSYNIKQEDKNNNVNIVNTIFNRLEKMYLLYSFLCTYYL